MADPRLEKWAKALAGYSVEVEPGQTVAIAGHFGAAPLLRAIAQEVVARGGFPVTMPIMEGPDADLLLHGSDEQLQYISPLERFIRTEADVVINVRAETNTRRL